MLEKVQKLTEMSRKEENTFDKRQFLTKVKYGHLEEEKKLYEENTAIYP